MKIYSSILLLLVFVAHAGADVGLYLVTQQNIAGVKEFSLQAIPTKAGKIEFQITIPFDDRIKKVKAEYRLWSGDMSTVLEEKPIYIVQHKPSGPWVATIAVHSRKLQNSTIEVFCGRNLQAETAYRIQLATYATSNRK